MYPSALEWRVHLVWTDSVKSELTLFPTEHCGRKLGKQVALCPACHTKNQES